MQILSRRIVIAAIAGAAALLPFAAATPADAAPSDGIPTAATMTVTTSAPTVLIGGQAGWSVTLDEVAGGQPTGLTGRVDIEVTQNGTTIDSVVRAVKSADQSYASSFVTTTAGPIVVSAIFVEATENESGAKGSASMIVLGKASVSVQATTVHAGDSIVPVVDLTAGSANADGRLQATAAGMPTLVCGPRIVSDTSASCPLEVPADTPSGTYAMTFTYGASPFYGDASTTADVQVIGAPSTGSTSGTRTGTPRTGAGTSTQGGAGTVTGNGAGSVVGAGAASGGFTTGSTTSGSTTAGATDTGASPAATDAPNTQPTAVAAQLPAGKPLAGPATAAAPVLTILPMLIPFAAAGLIGLLLVVLLIVLLVRRARKGAAA